MTKMWCKTTDGKEIDLWDPDMALFTVERIANVLARIDRFAGHWVRPVSVARHSVFLAEYLRAEGHSVEVRLQGLFHDAAEAFTIDIPTPLKELLFVASPFGPEEGFLSYREFEDGMLKRIFNTLEIEWPLRQEVHEADHWLTGQESQWVKGESDLYRGATTDPETVARMFVLRAEELFRDRAKDRANDTHRVV